jgi:hypothetical protein
VNTSVPAFLQRRDVWALLALILVSLAVRIPGVSSRAIWYDEAITLLETAGNPAPDWSESPTPAATQKEFLDGAPTVSEIATGLRETDVHPPVYYILLSKWRLLIGGSVEAARLFSVLISTASIVLFYLLLRTTGFARPFVPTVVYALSSGAVHYGHEARNYSLAMLLIMAATFCAFRAIKIEDLKAKKFWFFSFSMAIFGGLAVNTNYLSIYPTFVLLVWYSFWLPRKRFLYSILSYIIFLSISSKVLWIIPAQLDARPKQFQKALALGDEIRKIIDFNIEILWNPVYPSSGVRFAVLGTIALLGFSSLWYAINRWKEIDKQITSLMIGLAIAPSAGVVALDLIFNKDLGKSSYVLFAGPAIVFLLMLAAGDRRFEGAGCASGSSLTTRVVVAVVGFFIGLQLTGINFDLERTPGFAGSTIRSMAATIEASQPPPLVVIGAGHGRGDPATLIYELGPETLVCVVSNGSETVTMRQQISRYENVWFVFAKGRKTSAVEDQLYEDLTGDGGFRVVSRSKRLAHLQKRR